MNYEQIINEILISEQFKNLLRNYLAQKISNEYHYRDSEGELIRKEIRVLIKEEAKLMIKELINEYYEIDNIKTIIEKEITNMSRDKIIELLKGKFN